MTVTIVVTATLLWARHEIDARLDAREEAAGSFSADLPIPRLEAPPEFHEFDYSWQASTIEGDQYDVKQLQDQIVLLSLWASWCTPCRAESPTQDNLKKTLEDRGVEISLVLVSSEEVEEVRRFLSRQPGYDQFQILISKELPPAIWSEALPTTYLVDRDGSIKLRHVGAAKWDVPSVVELISSL